VPQDRLRKLTEENQELARNLKKELEQLRNPKPVKPATSVKRKGDGSARGSEERIMGTKKRGRDLDTERVSKF
jgi:hypothetical protein